MKSTELMASKYCMYSKDSYTDEERKSLCDGCEEDCEYNQKKEPGLENKVNRDTQ